MADYRIMNRWQEQEFTRKSQWAFNSPLRDTSPYHPCILGHWTDGHVKLIGVWFDLDVRVEKNWNDVTSSVASLTQKWVQRKMSMKVLVAMVNEYITSDVYYWLTDIPCPVCWWNILVRLLFRFRWKGAQFDANSRWMEAWACRGYWCTGIR